MPDLHLPIGPPPALPARPDALRHVRRRARQLRLRWLVACSTGALSLTVTALALSASADGRHSLQPVNPPAANPTADRTPGRPHVRTVAPPRVRSAPGAEPAPAPAAPGLAGPDPAPADQRDYPEVVTYEDGTLNVYRPQAVYSPPQGLLCANGTAWTRTPEGWCLRHSDIQNDDYGIATGQEDEWWLGMWMCRPPNNGSGTVNYSRLPRLRIVAPNTGEVVFDSLQRPWDRPPGDDPTGAQWNVPDGTCIHFASIWKSVDNAGKPVPNGDYRYDWLPTDAAFDDWATGTSGPTITVRQGDRH